METRYYGQCEHTFGDGDIERNSCLKRYFYVDDLFLGKNIKIAVCNEHFKLLVHQKMHDDGKSKNSPYWEYNDTYLSVIEDIIEEVINIRHKTWNYIENSYYKNMPKLDYIICERPFIYTQIPIDLAFELMNSPQTEYQIFTELRHRIKRPIKLILERALKYNKYKKYYQMADSYMKKLNYNSYLEQTELLKLLSEILSKTSK